MYSGRKLLVGKFIIFLNFACFCRRRNLMIDSILRHSSFEHSHKYFSAFDTIADLYFVRIPRSIYVQGNTKILDKFRFIFMYNYQKIRKHVFGYNYKKRCNISSKTKKQKVMNVLLSRNKNIKWWKASLIKLIQPSTVHEKIILKVLIMKTSW